MIACSTAIRRDASRSGNFPSATQRGYSRRRNANSRFTSTYLSRTVIATIPHLLNQARYHPRTIPTVPPPQISLRPRRTILGEKSPHPPQLQPHILVLSQLRRL